MAGATALVVMTLLHGAAGFTAGCGGGRALGVCGAAALQPRSERRRAPRCTVVASAETLSDLSRFSVLTSNQGCWSGWEVAFDPRTGRPVALDEAYVPEELLEWGAPSREKISQPSGANWERTAFRVLPEAGCAADECSVSVLTFGLDLAAASVVATPRRQTVGPSARVG